jgi:hypothetical protein
VIGIPKKSAEDTALVATNRNTGETLRIPVEKDAKVELHTVGVHYNGMILAFPYPCIEKCIRERTVYSSIVNFDREVLG